MDATESLYKNPLNKGARFGSSCFSSAGLQKESRLLKALVHSPVIWWNLGSHLGVLVKKDQGSETRQCTSIKGLTVSIRWWFS